MPDHASPKRNPVVLAETDYLRLVQDAHWTFAQRPNVTGAVAIVAVTEQQEIVLVDQYRIPLQGRVIELPAGLVGDLAGQRTESLADAARRELLEETGYEAEQVHILTAGVSSAGLTDESVHLVLAEGLRRTGRGGGDGSEDIVVCHVPLVDLQAWLKTQQQQGKRVDFKVFAGLCFWQWRSRA